MQNTTKIAMKSYVPTEADRKNDELNQAWKQAQIKQQMDSLRRQTQGRSFR